MKKKIVLTGGAGFIGSHVAEKLIAKGIEVVAIDNFDPFYNVEQKQRNLSNLADSPLFKLVELSISETSFIDRAQHDTIFAGCDAIIHLAAKAGVRPSIEDPIGYQDANVRGTQNMLELARSLNVKQFVFASSSSVYGVNPDVPWSEDHAVLKPISPYASTKVSGELLGHVYSHLYGIRFLGLRFFTVYGPRQRPDLAIHKFAKLILAGKPIPFFGDGSTRRDYTYIDDIVSGILAAVDYESTAYELFNLGNNQTVSLLELVDCLENTFERKAILNRLPSQPGDVAQTWANIEKAKKLLGYNPSTNLSTGLGLFKEWLSTIDSTR